MSLVQATKASDEAAPQHVAIIMDGNRRWARQRGLPRAVGHRQGLAAVRRIVEGAAELGIANLTLYSFSAENWNRPADEVEDLMGLLRIYIRQDLKELHRNGVRVRVIGEREGVAPDIVALIEEAETITADNRRMTLIIAFNYGGQDEIVRAARRIAEAVKAGRLQAEEITKPVFAGELLTAGIPDPDLVIRTSGEQRLSNFLIWQAAYAELVFVEEFWPEFTRASLEAAIAQYHSRERRYGAG
ncbi:MAG: isoprenyl transferase [Alphaproteobacteria bacterium]|nr:isoprenyl transferase [Alphaproteobacteria bacterium]